MVDIDRRTLLQGTGAAVLVAALDRLTAVAMAGQPPAANVASTKKHHQPKKLGSGSVPYTAPYSVTESCVLSQDCFLTAQVVLDDPSQDRIVAFENNGTVEALVLSGGNTLAYLGRDSSAVSGWSYTTLWSVTDQSLTDIAAITASDGTVFAMVLQTAGSQRRPHWATLDSSGQWQWQDGPDLIGDSTTPLRSGLDLSGDPYFYAVMTAPAANLPKSTVLFWQPKAGQYSAASTSTTLGGEDIADAWLTWDASVPAGAGILARSSIDEVSWYPQITTTAYDNDNTTALGPGTAVLWNYLNPVVSGGPLEPSLSGASYLFYDAKGQTLNYVDDDDPTVPISVSQSGQTPLAGAVAWSPPWTDISVALLDTSGTVSIVNDTQVEAEPLSPRMPIAGGLSAAVGLTTDASESTLFVVDDAATLNILSRDPSTLAWSSIPVSQDSPQVTDFSAWRVQLTVVDANGVPVASSEVTVTPDQTLGIWQGSGNTIISPSSPLTTTTDNMGRITFSYPATELATATLSVEPTQNGSSSGNAISVQPASTVNSFLSGTGTLNGMTALSGTSLLAATTASGQALLPKLTAMSSNQQQTAASSVASAMTNCMSAGLGSAPGSGDPTQWSLDLSGDQASYKSARGGAKREILTDSAWWDSAKHDLESAWHAVEHGLVTMTSITATWVAGADNWVVDLAVEIGNGVSDVMSYAINDVRSAISAIGGIINSLGADLDDFIEWLRLDVEGFFKAVASNADTMYGWLSQGSSQLSQALSNLDITTNDYFQNLEGTVTADLQSIGSELSGQSISTFVNSISSSIQSSDPRGVQAGFGRGSAHDKQHRAIKARHKSKANGKRDPKKATLGESPSQLALQVALQQISTDVHYLWLLDKALNFLEGSEGFSLTPDSSVQDPLSNLLAAIKQDGSDLITALGTLVQNFQQACPQVSDLYTVPFPTLLSLLAELINDLLEFADNIIDTLLKLAEAAVAILDSVFTQDTTSLVPMLGGILAHFGVNDSLSLGKLFSYIVAFPATIYNESANSGQPLFPGGVAVGSDDRVKADKRLGASDDWALGLATTAATVQVIWSFWDVAIDAFAARGENIPFFLSVGDSIMNAILQCVQWPGTPRADGTTPPPFSTTPPLSNSVDKLSFSSWMLAWSDTLLCAAIGKVDQGNSADADLVSTWFTVLLSTFAISNLVVSSVWAWKSNSSGAVKANVIMSYIPDATEIFVSEFVDAATDEGSMILKLAIDLICNFGAGVTDIAAYG